MKQASGCLNADVQLLKNAKELNVTTKWNLVGADAQICSIAYCRKAAFHS